MSIAAANENDASAWVWGVWLAAAVVMAVLFAWRRPRKAVAATATTMTAVTAAMPESNAASAGERVTIDYQPVPVNAKALQLVPLLAVTGLVSFCVWVAAQGVYVTLRPPTISPAMTTLPATATWLAGDRAALSLVPNLCGYAVGVTLLIFGSGIAAVGYGVRRIPNGLLGGTIGIFIALPVIHFALQATEWALDRLDIDHSKKHELLQLLADEPSAAVRVAAVLAAVVAAPLFEELLFRGCIQGGLRRATGSPLVGIVVASTLFASIHLAWTIPPIFVLSLLLGAVYERTRNLWAVTVMHALFNLFSIVTT